MPLNESHISQLRGHIRDRWRCKYFSGFDRSSKGRDQTAPENATTYGFERIVDKWGNTKTKGPGRLLKIVDSLGLKLRIAKIFVAICIVGVLFCEVWQAQAEGPFYNIDDVTTNLVLAQRALLFVAAISGAAWIALVVTARALGRRLADWERQIPLLGLIAATFGSNPNQWPSSILWRIKLMDHSTVSLSKPINESRLAQDKFLAIGYAKLVSYVLFDDWEYGIPDHWSPEEKEDLKAGIERDVKVISQISEAGTMDLGKFI